MSIAWRGLLDPRWVEALDATPFLARCRAKQAGRQELLAFLGQQYLYSRHFTRYLCALLSNLADDEDRLGLLQNLMEEMGFGQNGGRPHSRIYLDMMQALGVEPDAATPTEPTRDLVETMLSLCRNSNPVAGLGALCLGAEAVVPHLYTQILSGFEGAGEKAENLEFFRIHISADDDHALTMGKIIERYLDRDRTQLGVLQESAQRVLQARQSFFAQFHGGTE